MSCLVLVMIRRDYMKLFVSTDNDIVEIDNFSDIE